MIKYIIRRLIQAIPVLIGISFICYAILLLSGSSPVERFAQNPHITQAQIDAFKHRWGLDQPWPIQYCSWLGACGDKGILNFLPTALGGGNNGILHGDFGYSISDGRLVSSIILERALPTFVLAMTAWVIWLVIAFIAGVYAAVRRYSFFDSGLTVFNYVGFSLPTFWLGIMLISIFSVPPLKLLPASGMCNTRVVGVAPYFGDCFHYIAANPFPGLVDLGSHLVLPVVTLVVVNIAFDSRFIRSSMLDALNQDYVKTARAKGVSERRVVFRHALRNALLPVVTNIGLEIPFLFAGAIVTETIFSWPGMGRLFIEATGHTDFPVLMGILVITSTIVVFANIFADVVYAIVDPRVKYD